jgi:hypothetical protein
MKFVKIEYVNSNPIVLTDSSGKKSGLFIISVMLRIPTKVGIPLFLKLD